MCGIVGAISERQVSGILLEGLRRLEYRGYDSAGMAVHDGVAVARLRRTGKVQELVNAHEAHALAGCLGIAHTRWATHGVPAERNAHPHMSGDQVAVVHNGIIENYEQLKNNLIAQGKEFTSETDTEVIAHLVAVELESGSPVNKAIQGVVCKLEGAFALGLIVSSEPDLLYAARKGSPLVIGVGIGENFLASDQLALLPVTDRFMFLQDGDVARLSRKAIEVWDANEQPVERHVVEFAHAATSAEKGEYKHYMLKEIFEQPQVISEALEGRIAGTKLLEACFGSGASASFDRTRHVLILACGTSYHSGLVARYWMEEIAGVSCTVEIASEFRYRKAAIPADTLLITISQSGETADTLAALRHVKERVLDTLAICNVPSSSLVRESGLSLMTHAGPEIGVASTKAFTTQLVALMLTTIALGRRNGLTEDVEADIVGQLRTLPHLAQEVLKLDEEIERVSAEFAEKHHSLFLGRGALYPIALEGALKLKEISYIHAEAYPAGELKHGPLALVDNDMPVVTVAPSNDMLDKLKANLQEVRARGGELYVFAGQQSLESQEGMRVIHMPEVPSWLEPIAYTLPLQLLSYHVAVLKGTDVDQPRNLAKSVTVE